MIRPIPKCAFSLVEVVLATAIFAGAIVAIIGLTAPMQRKVSDIIDSEVAARLTKNIDAELRAIGYTNLMASPLLPRLDPIAPSPSPLYLYATADGSRVVLDSDADHPLTSGTPPGLSDRERYFQIRIVSTVPPLADAGWLSLRAEATWPFRLPIGPATIGATAHDTDGSQIVDTTQRQSLSYFFALNP